jgi:hypothetical protein
VQELVGEVLRVSRFVGAEEERVRGKVGGDGRPVEAATRVGRGIEAAPSAGGGRQAVLPRGGGGGRRWWWWFRPAEVMVAEGWG